MFAVDGIVNETHDWALLTSSAVIFVPMKTGKSTYKSLPHFRLTPIRTKYSTLISLFDLIVGPTKGISNEPSSHRFLRKITKQEKWHTLLRKKSEQNQSCTRTFSYRFPHGQLENFVILTYWRPCLLCKLFNDLSMQQRHIQNPVNHLGWSFFAKTVNSFQQLNIFRKSSTLEVWLCSKCAFEQQTVWGIFKDWEAKKALNFW